MYVTVKSADLKNNPSMFGNTMSQVNFGESVVIIENRGKWVNIRTANNITGWTQILALRARQVTSSTSATTVEISLAGKGFSGEVEIEYRKSGLDYTAVDAMEKVQVYGTELLDFITQGRLFTGE